MRATTITPGVELGDALDEWDLVMRQLNRSESTRKVYATAVRQLDAHQRARGCPTVVDEIKPSHVRSYLVDVLERSSASTAVTRWGGRLAFFKWATHERLCGSDPMADVERPQRPELLTPVLSDDELRAMFATCGGDFDGIRDAALMRFMLTTGCRRSEIAGITLDDLDLKAQTVRVMGKGRRERLVHVEDGTALALRKYLRARRLHPKAAATDRLVVFELERPAEWLTEAELDDAAELLRPGVLGALCDAVAATMRQLPSLPPVRDLRMADFARFVGGYDAAHGTKALAAYRGKVGDIFDEALAADTLASAVLAFMDGDGHGLARRDRWQGKVSELLVELEHYRPKLDTHERDASRSKHDQSWPSTAHHLSGLMTRSAAMLRRAGIVWHRPSKDSRRLARLDRAPDSPFAAELPLVVVCPDGAPGEQQHGGNEAHEPNQSHGEAEQ